MTEEIPKENKETLTDPIQPKQKNDNETQTEKHHEISQEIDLKFKNKIKKTKEIEIQTDIEKELPKEREEKVINKIINETEILSASITSSKAAGIGTMKKTIAASRYNATKIYALFTALYLLL